MVGTSTRYIKELLQWFFVQTLRTIFPDYNKRYPDSGVPYTIFYAVNNSIVFVSG